PDEAAAEPSANPDLTAIQQAIDSYVAAFNQADAKALAAHWTPAGQFVQPSGDVLQGRQQLEESFTAYFAEAKQVHLELLETNVRLLSPSVAVETGIARVLLPEQEPSETEYEAIHVKTAEGWKIDSVREQEPPQPPPSSYDKLQELEWMLGRWVDADESAVIETTCRWTTNRNFLVRSFKVFVEDRVDFEGTQVIGWDAAAQVIRSWMFDSDGGFGVGRWSGGNGRWTVQSLNVLADGRRASATQIYELVDENTVRFSSIGRQVDGELLPNIDPVLVVRADQ
ncbi:MAG: SgcJ/EcaC family oxidoreductase, partial [Pirellulaceae bacterium]|nr:SgcJ/EcaC family oxidoreductase [Pirellulaceae bacterium]